ncbi:3-oxoacyl-[acyl-carrier-protein] reductase FabG-like protein, partial [Tanacetum coccineum]
VMAMELGEHKIRVNSISPGIFKSEITEELLQKKWFKNVVSKTMPLKKLGVTDPALTSLVKYLIHGSSNYVTGNIFIVDSGYTLPGKWRGLRGFECSQVNIHHVGGLQCPNSYALSVDKVSIPITICKLYLKLKSMYTAQKIGIFEIIVAARQTERLKALCHEIIYLDISDGQANLNEARKGNVMAVAVVLDVCADGPAIEASVLKAWVAFGCIDTLINNAGFRGGKIDGLGWVGFGHGSRWVWV